MPAISAPFDDRRGEMAARDPMPPALASHPGSTLQGPRGAGTGGLRPEVRAMALDIVLSKAFQADPLAAARVPVKDRSST